MNSPFFKKKCRLINIFKLHFANFNSSYKLSEIKKEYGAFEKLLFLGNYEVEKYMNKELIKKYKECIKNDYNKLKNMLYEKECKSVYEKYLYDCVRNNDYEDLIIGDVIYENKKKILCIGEANLSFSALLQKNLNICSVVATSMEDKLKLIKNYGNIFTKNLKVLEQCGGIYISNINVETIDKHFLKNTFDIIVFNFPFVLPTKELIEKKWKVKLDKEDNNYIKYYKKAEYFLFNKLFYYLFKNSSILLKEKGYLHLRINDKYLTCKFPNDFSMSFVQKIDFYNSFMIYKLLKYVPSIYDSSFTNSNINNLKKNKNVIYTPNGKIFKSFKMKHTSTLIFQKI
ncbi:conserved Plasmodium protein, unknown function [Plasmodium gallinaceum]|uniref:25S rRNA (uridine-N(3))-methyltransferase BMT5-like domain-containing protein n=1 Tax=Plasmodium gallinaceum TaxID=5849 RepID=A0A1J1GLT3_PLAGA|nr:conserved Plasmodium protein, unknown function [Plasmodium gallinaceum]CRG93181.1 conserved Plasmodium protein, unknown function [Plasmodium gallinaceum]